MSISPHKEILSHEFLVFVSEQIEVTGWELFFVYLGFDKSATDHWIHNFKFLEDILTTGLKKWREKPIMENSAADKNISQLRDWILTALKQCERNDLVDDLSTQDIYKMIDTISEKLTTERHRLYAFLGIEESPTGTLKEKIFTALESWLNKQSNHFWKYQELLRAFREQGNIKAINEIEAKYGIKECSIMYRGQESEQSFSHNCGQLDQPTTKKRSFDIAGTGNQEEIETKKFKSDTFLKTRVLRTKDDVQSIGSICSSSETYGTKTDQRQYNREDIQNRSEPIILDHNDISIENVSYSQPLAKHNSGTTIHIQAETVVIGDNSTLVSDRKKHDLDNEKLKSNTGSRGRDSVSQEGSTYVVEHGFFSGTKGSSVEDNCFPIENTEKVAFQTSNKTSANFVGISPLTENTDPKQVVESHRSENGDRLSSDKKTSQSISLLQCSPGRGDVPGNAGVLTPVQCQQSSKDANISESNLEVNACNKLTSSTERKSILQKEQVNFGDISDSCITLRDYQQELGALPLLGVNTIICAGTNSGKTYVALYVIENHLNKYPNGTVAFLTRTNILLNQQFELARKLLPSLKQNGKIFKWQADQLDFTSETFKNVVKATSVVFLTPQSLCNYLEEESDDSRVDLNQFTLLVLDECHHTYGNTPYNNIMRHYRKLKYGTKVRPLPQILGLTASPGTKKAKDIESAKDHLIGIMANLDVLKLSVVRKYEKSLLEYCSMPKKVNIKTKERQKDPIKDVLLNVINDVEDVFDKLVTKFLKNPENRTEKIREALSKLPKEKKTLRYIQWLNETRKSVEEIPAIQSTIPRILHACLRHLEFYAECLEINALLDFNDVREMIHAGYINLKEESDKATTEKERFLFKKLEEVYTYIFELGRRIEGNPDIEKMIEILEKEYGKFQDESRFLVFVKTRKTAKALSGKMPEHFKSCFLTGSQTSKEEGGLSRQEQEDIVTKFRDGIFKCVVTTSVAAEGLDIQKCSVVIRYRLITNEISSFQMGGRIRQKGGKDVMVGNQKEFEKEDINVERQYLIQEAIQRVLKEDVTEAILTEERENFKKEEHERGRQKLRPDERNKGQFSVGCKLCLNDKDSIVDGQFIKRIKQTHSIVSDKEIFGKIQRRQNKKPYVSETVKVTDKVFGIVCGHFWGNILTYQDCEFVSLAHNSVRIIEKETQQPFSFKKWSDVADRFPLDDITPVEVTQYRTQQTPIPSGM